VVNCHELEVTKTVNTSFDRQYSWVISKVASVTSLVLQIGATALVDFTVSVNNSGFTDNNFKVFGDINIYNPAPISATIVDVSDVVSPDIAALVNCPVTLPGYVLASEETLVCSYQADLPDSSERENTATVTIQNNVGLQDGVFDPVGIMFTTDFTDTKDVDFSKASMNEIDECINVTDSVAGSLGAVCYGQTFPKEFTYQQTVGPFATSGLYTANNIADFVTNDTETTATDPASVDIQITVLEGEILGDTDERKPDGKILGATDTLGSSGSNAISLIFVIWLIFTFLTFFYFLRERKNN